MKKSLCALLLLAALMAGTAVVSMASDVHGYGERASDVHGYMLASDVHGYILASDVHGYVNKA